MKVRLALALAGLSCVALLGAGVGLGGEEDVRLLVNTVPAGALVTVDGRKGGSTPVEILVEPGRHYVRLSRAGYLENARAITSVVGQESTLAVRLTPSMAAAVAQVDDDTQSAEPIVEKKRGRRVLPYIAASVAGAAGGALLYDSLRSKHEPPHAAASVSPQGTGLEGVTTFTFDASQSRDPDGDALSYRWDLGDGRSASDRVVTHVYEREGTYAVRLTVDDGKQAASADFGPVSVVRTITGDWEGIFPGSRNKMVVRFQSSGTSLAGLVELRNYADSTRVLESAPLAGTFSCSNAVLPCRVAFSAAPFFIRSTLVFDGSYDKARHIGGVGSIDGYSAAVELTHP